MIVGVDIGTQSLKAVVLDDALRPRGSASAAYDVRYPKPGWAEQEPRAWEVALPQAVAEALDAAGAKASEIRALGIAGQLDGCVAVDAVGCSLGPCLIWLDRRAAMPSMPDIEARVRATCGIVADPGHMAAKIGWLRANGADRAARFHQPVSYMVSRLTGRHVMDRALASTTMLYGLESRAWDSDLLQAFDVPAATLPELAEAEDKAGPLTAEGARLTGLPEGIPVAVGTGDDFSTPLGAGIVDPGRLACVLGTAEVVGALDTTAKIDEGGLLETHAYAGGRYFIENPGWYSGGALEWFIATHRLHGPAELDALAAEAPAGSDGVLFLPALSGAMAPEWDARARGCFYGLTPSHGLPHLSRAVLEGCAYAMRDVVERLRALEVPLEAIRLLGGGARSRLWAQIRASISGLPVERPETVDTSPIGAAMLAAVASGAEADLAACARRVEDVREVIHPEPADAAAYDAAHARYRELFAALKPVFAAAEKPQ